MGLFAMSRVQLSITDFWPLLGLFGCAISCAPQPAYICQQDAQCIGQGGNLGRCESNGTCSFPDSTCPGTQRRYADGLNNDCVAVSRCTSNLDCVSTDGRYGICETSGWCSYFDASCSASRRVTDGATNACVASQNGCIAQVSLGSTHSCALRTDGAVYCWGLNDNGELGDGSVQDRPTPTRVVGLPAGHSVTQIATGEAHTCALLDDHSVWCWGTNEQHALGQCNDSTLPSSATPLSVPSWDASVSLPACDSSTPFYATSITAGGVHSCAIGGDGNAYCWGENTHGSQGGQCGQDFTAFDAVPGPIKTADTSSQSISAVEAGDEYSCLVRSDHSVWCFGSNDLYELGQGGGNSDASYKPLAVTGVSDAEYLTLADETACIVTRQKGLFCWGSGATGLFGTQLSNVDRPTYIENCTAAFSGGTAGTLCVNSSDGSFSCFGANDLGQCGNGSIAPQVAPSSPTPTYLATVAKASLGAGHSCAVTTDGALWCWGANDHGQLGDGQILDATSLPVTVPKRIEFPCP